MIREISTLLPKNADELIGCSDRQDTQLSTQSIESKRLLQRYPTEDALLTYYSVDNLLAFTQQRFIDRCYFGIAPTLVTVEKTYGENTAIAFLIAMIVLIVERFGGKVQVCGENIIHLMRGEIYQLQGKIFFICGGAMSHDIELRQPYTTWWPQEQVSVAEEKNAWKNLNQAGTVDFILTHTCPDTIVQEMFGKVPSRNATERFLSRVAERLPDVPWYFGHHHEDKDWGRFHAMYNRVLRII